MKRFGQYICEKDKLKIYRTENINAQSTLFYVAEIRGYLSDRDGTTEVCTKEPEREGTDYPVRLLDAFTDTRAWTHN